MIAIPSLPKRSARVPEMNLFKWLDVGVAKSDIDNAAMWVADLSSRVRGRVGQTKLWKRICGTFGESHHICRDQDFIFSNAHLAVRTGKLP